MVFPPPSSLISTQRYFPLAQGHGRGAEKNGETCCCRHKNSSQRLFVTTSSLIPTFLLPSVLEEAILCLQTPRSLKEGAITSKSLGAGSLWRQPASLGRAGQGWPTAGGEPRANISVLQHAELGGVWLPVRRQGFPAVPGQTHLPSARCAP